MRTLFEEGFGVVGGWGGTIFGAEVIGLGVVIILGLGPLGAFIAVFCCATAFGIAGSELSKWFGGRIYDAGDKFGNRVYHSFDELIGNFQ